MGFFSKLKDNIHHGGVKLEVTAPGSASLNDAELPITATLTASEPATIKWVKAELVAQSQNMAFNAQGMTQQQYNQQQAQEHIVAINQSNESFSMAAGETKTLQLNIVMNSAAQAAQSTGTDGAMANIAKVASELETLSNITNPGAYRYSVRVIANVAGIALDPSKTLGISINGPGQFGTTANIHL